MEFSLFFVISLIVFWLKNPKSVFTWITFLTAFSFSLFGHKEIRYIFPVDILSYDKQYNHRIEKNAKYTRD